MTAGRVAVACAVLTSSVVIREGLISFSLSSELLISTLTVVERVWV